MENVLDRCGLFTGLSAARRTEALQFFGARRAHYGKGAFLNRMGDPLPHFGLVLSGTVQVCADDMDGNRTIMASVGSGGTFGESLCYLQEEAFVYICAVTDVEVLWLSTDRLRAGATDAAGREFSHRFTAMLARRTLDMNERIQILSKRTLREKLITFFSAYGKGEVTIPFDRAAMAAYIGTDRAALSRELSRMRAEGLLTFRKNQFTIL